MGAGSVPQPKQIPNMQVPPQGPSQAPQQVSSAHWLSHSLLQQNESIAHTQSQQSASSQPGEPLDSQQSPSPGHTAHGPQSC